MKYNYNLLYILVPVLLAVGCGSGKKLQIEDLQTKNNELQKNVSDLQGELNGASAKQTSLVQEYSEYKKECGAVQEKYEQAQGTLDAETKTLEEINGKLEEALIDFEDKGVDLSFDKGLIYVSMADNLLYKSGSSIVNEKGIQALSKVAGVLNAYPRLRVIVLGNTDDVQFKKGSDNWTLSTERANGVVRILRDAYKVDPARLTAAGKGKYNPVADNGTAEGRAKNRRTDIILNPNIEKLLENVNR